MLEVEMKTTIKTLNLKGYNKTQIGHILNIDRETVRKVLRSEEGLRKINRQEEAYGRQFWTSTWNT